MTNLIIILTLSFSFLFGVDSPKSESHTESLSKLQDNTTKIPFDPEIFQQNQPTKKRLQKRMQNRPARSAKGAPKPAGTSIYMSNQKRDKTLLKQTPTKKILQDKVHLEKQKNAKQKLNALWTLPKSGNTAINHNAFREKKFNHQTSTRDRSRTTRTTGTEYYFYSVDSLYNAFGWVLESGGAGCNECDNPQLEDLNEWHATTIDITSQSSFEEFGNYSGFEEYYFQFIDENETGEYDEGEIYAVSCENATTGEWEGGNLTVAYNGNVYDLDFPDFWAMAYDFDWESDENDEFEFLGEFNGHEYYVSNFESTWSDAYNMVEDEEAHLVTISSQEENDFIFEHTGGGVWIGFTDQYDEGNWEWVTGEDADYTNWGEDEPNNMDGEQHWAYMFETGQWDDLNDEPKGFVYEIGEAQHFELTNFEISINGGDVTDIEAGESATVTIEFDNTGAEPYAGMMAILYDADFNDELDPEVDVNIFGEDEEDGAFLLVDNMEPDQNMDIGVIEFPLSYEDDDGLGFMTFFQQTSWHFTSFDPEYGYDDNFATLHVGGFESAYSISGQTNPPTPNLMVYAGSDSMQTMPLLTMTNEEGEYQLDVSHADSFMVMMYDGLDFYDNIAINPPMQFVGVDGHVSGIDFEIEEYNTVVWGHVTNSDGYGIYDANVYFSHYDDSSDVYNDAWTDENGYYELWIQGGYEYSVSVWADGYEDYYDYIYIEDSGDFEYNVTLGSGGDGLGTVFGSVHDLEGNPIDLSNIYFWNGDGEGYYTFSEFGDWYWIELPPGDYSAYAYSDTAGWWPDLWPGGTSLHVEEGSEEEINFTLFPTNEFGYVIVHVDGIDESAYVQVQNDNEEFVYGGWTNWYGDVGTALSYGEYEVQVYGNTGNTVQYANFSVGSDSMEWVYIDMGGGNDEWGVIQGSVMNGEDGYGVEGAWIHAWNDDEWHETWTDEDGYYSMLIPAGGYEVEACADGFNCAWNYVEVGPNDEIWIDFLIEPEEDDNLVSNGGFEHVYEAENGQLHAEDWSWFPEEAENHHIEASGNMIYNSAEQFWALEGEYSLKMWGQYNDALNYTAYYQTFDDLSPGTNIYADAMFMSHQDDWIGQGTNKAYLFISYFDMDWNHIGFDSSAHFNGYYEPSMWHGLWVEGVVPEGASYVNIGVEYIQENNDQNGSIYVDNVYGEAYSNEGMWTHLGQFEGNTYWLSPGGEEYLNTWTEAYDMLESWEIPEYHIVTIGSQEENDFIQEASGFNDFWIGFTDQEDEGDWQWVTGEGVTYTNWADGEPNNSNEEDFAHMWGFDGTWNDHQAEHRARFVLEIESIDEAGSILDVSDVPDDQGGRVYVKFSGSIHDTDSLRTAEMYTVERLDGDTWVGLNSVSAYGNDEYVVEATTLADSTSENDAIMTYRIIAAMEEGNFASDPGSGYSVDNIAPGAPTGVVAAVSGGVVYLEWAHSDANDLDYYAVYRSTDPEFVPSEENMIGSSEGSDFADDVEELGDYYYGVTALDLHENESAPSEFVNVTLLSLDDIRGLPEVFTLHQNYPNPFNPNTQIEYALPTDANVSVVIYDLMGRQISTLVNQQVSAGYHSVMWNATSDMGSPVSAGVYIYTITANDFRDVKKMILLK